MHRTAWLGVAALNGFIAVVTGLVRCVRGLP